MRITDQLSTDEIGAIFCDEVSARGGTVREQVFHGSCLFARSILAGSAEIRPGDGVRGGVAMRVDADGVSVHPYTFRLVCQNGAVHAQAVDTRRLDGVEFYGADQAESELREAIRECCAPEAFAAAAGQMRRAAGDRINMFLAIAPMLAHLPGRVRDAMMGELLRVAPRDREGTRYELMNHVTAVARETRDPQTKWRLEELGGAIAAGVTPRPKPLGAAKDLAAVPAYA